jgi:ribonuclease P protein component
MTCGKIDFGKYNGFFLKKMVLFPLCRVPTIPKRKNGAVHTGFWRGLRRRPAGASSLAGGRKAAGSWQYRSFPFMLPQKHRLPYKEFRVRGYQEVATPYFLVKARRNPTKENRFGVVIGVSSVKSAARRNFWRRQSKSVFLAVPQEGLDLLVIFRPHTKLPSKNVFQKSLSEAIASLIL